MNHLNCQEVIRIVKAKANSVKDLIELKMVNQMFHYTIDTYMLDTWATLITNNDLIVAFDMNYHFIIRKAFEALQWYRENKEKFVPRKPRECEASFESFKLPSIATYDFASKFVTNRYKEIDDIMIEYGYINCEDEINGITPLYYSSNHGVLPRIRRLLESGASITCSRNRSSFDVFVSHGLDDPEHRSIIDLFISKGGNVNEALMNAERDSNTVTYLLSKGADPNYIDGDGMTPLVVYSNSAPTKSIQLLLDRGANLHYRDKDGLTALDHSLKINNIAYHNTLLLLQAGGQFFSPTDDIKKYFVRLISETRYPGVPTVVVDILEIILVKQNYFEETFKDTEETIFTLRPGISCLRMFVRKCKEINLTYLFNKRNKKNEPPLGIYYVHSIYSDIAGSYCLKILLNEGVNVEDAFTNVPKGDVKYKESEKLLYGNTK